MKKSDSQIVFIDGKKGVSGDFPVAVCYTQTYQEDMPSILVVDPILDEKLVRNLYGRIMTLLEATTEQYKLKSVKDLFSKELTDWKDSIFASARELAESDGNPIRWDNVYRRYSDTPVLAQERIEQ